MDGLHQQFILSLKQEAVISRIPNQIDPKPGEYEFGGSSLDDFEVFSRLKTFLFKNVVYINN